MKLAWSNLAVQEMREVRGFSINRCGRDVALRYVEDLRDATKRVAVDPHAARVLRGDLRIVRVRLHCLIVHVGEKASVVTIARLLHVARDIGRHLP